MRNQQQIRRNSGGNRGCCGCVAGCLGGLVFSLLSLLGLCGGLYFYMMQNAPQAPNPNFTPNPVAASQFENTISQAASAAAQTRRFDVQISEDQASSWLNLNAPLVADAQIPVSNLQVRFQNGQTSVYGEVDALGLGNVGTEIGLSYQVTPAGQVVVTVADVAFGGLGVPGGFKEQLSSQIQSAIDQQLREISGSYYVESISSINGQLIVRGRIN